MEHFSACCSIPTTRISRSSCIQGLLAYLRSFSQYHLFWGRDALKNPAWELKNVTKGLHFSKGARSLSSRTVREKEWEVQPRSDGHTGSRARVQCQKLCTPAYCFHSILWQFFLRAKSTQSNAHSGTSSPQMGTKRHAAIWVLRLVASSSSIVEFNGFKGDFVFPKHSPLQVCRNSVEISQNTHTQPLCRKGACLCTHVHIHTHT